MPIRGSLIPAFFLLSFVFSGNIRKVSAQAPPSVESVLMQYHITDTIPGLRVALKNPNPNIRTLAAGMLANDKDVDSIPMLRDALDNERTESVRLSLAASLATLKDWQGLDLL